MKAPGGLQDLAIGSPCAERMFFISPINSDEDRRLKGLGRLEGFEGYRFFFHDRTPIRNEAKKMDREATEVEVLIEVLWNETSSEDSFVCSQPKPQRHRSNTNKIMRI